MTFDPSRLPEFELDAEPSAWEVQGLGNEVLIVYATSRGRGTDTYEYDLLLAGHPGVLFPFAITSETLFEDSYTMDPWERPANDFDWTTVVGTGFERAPDRWRVELRGDESIELWANDHEERDGEHLFTLAVRGGGPGLPVLRVSAALVERIEHEASVRD